MKVTQVANLFLQIDPLHKRVDLQRPMAHLFAVIIAAVWAYAGLDGDSYGFWVRFAASLLFVGAVRLLLGGMGASRLSCILLVISIMVFGRDYTAPEIMLANVYAAVMLLAQLYFIYRGKFTALTVMLVSGAFIAGTGSHARNLLLLFVLLMLSRVVWHGVLERISKKAFVLFAAKAVVLALLVPVIYYLVDRFMPFSYNLAYDVPSLTMPVWIWALLGLIGLRGLWATLLLKTDRSPLLRPMRMYYACFGIGFFILVFLVFHFGERVFLPGAIDALDTFGLNELGVSSSAYLVYAGSLFLTAGVDRSLFRDTKLALRLRRVLNAPLSE